jgi:DNA-directed RNA polymerase specialized sigma24 family protein
MAHGEVLEREEYVRTRQEALPRSARRLVADPIDARDLLQTALVRTYGRVGRHSGRERDVRS